MEFTTHQAKTQFSKLLALAQQGQEVVITTGQKKTPVAKLVPVERKGGIRMGLMLGVKGPLSDEDVLAPLYTDEELDEIENNPL